MVNYLDSKRIMGTSTERLGAPASTGTWKFLDRTTLGSEGDEITVSSLPDKRYYMILGDIRDGTGDHGTSIKLNNDTTQKYAVRRSVNGASYSASVNLSNGGYITDSRQYDNFSVTYLANFPSREKIWINNNVHRMAAGSGTSPTREDGVGKWTNSTDAVSTFTYRNWHSGNYGAGSEAVVLGYDPDDTHTDNYWQELASETSTSANDIIDSGTFTAKKYLWIQIYNPAKPSGGNSYVYFNNVYTGTQHSGRSNTNGANPTNQSSFSDYQLTGSNGSIINHDVSASGTVTGLFTNMFVLNIATKEKLSIVHSVSGWTNAGSGVAPVSFECVNKWTNTSNQITSVQCGAKNTSNYMGSGSIIKVWGAD